MSTQPAESRAPQRERATSDAARPRVVVGVNGSPASRTALRWACWWARRTGSIVTAVGAWRPQTAAGWVINWDPTPEMVSRIGAIVDDLGDAAAGVAVDIVAPYSGAAEAILDRAEGADLVVLGRAGHSRALAALLGSVAVAAVHHAPCPVLLVDPDDEPPEDHAEHAPRVVVGVDGSECSTHAVRWGAALASASHGDLEAVTVWEDPTSEFDIGLSPSAFEWPADDRDRAARLRLHAEQTLDRALGQALGPAHRRAVRSTVLAGHPAGSLRAVSEHASTLVVGTRGLGGVKGMLLGSVSTAVAVGAHGPVLVVRGDADPPPVL